MRILSWFRGVVAACVLMTAATSVLHAQQGPLFTEHLASVFDPSSRTYFSLQATGGDDFGGQLPYTSFGATHILGSPDDSVTLFNGQMLAQYDGSPAGSIGVQQRWMVNLPVVNSAILGAGAYVDFTQSRYDNVFQQVNLNFELLTESSWLSRANIYLPIGEIQDTTGLDSRTGGGVGQVSLVGTSVMTGGALHQWMDVALMGTDLELGRKLLNYRMEVYGGYYNWNGPLLGFANGVKGGVRGYLTENVSGNLNISHDEFFGTSLFGGITYFFGGRGGSRPMAFANLMTLPAQRSQQVSIGNAMRTSSTFVPVLDSSGDPLQVYFVAEGGTGLGTLSSPASVSSVLGNSAFGAGSVMVLLDSNGNLTTPIALTAERQQVLGGGSSGSSVVDFSLALGQPAGTTQVSLTGLGNRPVLAPTAGNALTLTSENLVQGFTIDGSGGVTNGIVGTPGAAQTRIDDLVIQNVAGTGVLIQPSTNTTVTNTQFQNNGQDLVLNAANTTLSNLTSTGAVNGAFSLGGSGGDITGATVLSNLTISGAGGFGGLLLNNAQDGATITISDVSITGGTGSGLTITNSQAGSVYTLSNVDILNVGGAGIGIESSNGTLQMDAASSVINTGGAGFRVVGGGINSTLNGVFEQGWNAATVSVSDSHTGTLRFTSAGSVRSTLGSGLQFEIADGTYEFLGTTALQEGDAGIDVLGGNGTFAFHSAVIENTAGGTGVTIQGNGDLPVATFQGLSITTEGGTGFRVQDAGLTTISGAAMIHTTGAAALDASGTTLAIALDSVTSSGGGVSLNQVAGTVSIGTLTVSDTFVGLGMTESSATATVGTVDFTDLSSAGLYLQNNSGLLTVQEGMMNSLGGSVLNLLNASAHLSSIEVSGYGSNGVLASVTEGSHSLTLDELVLQQGGSNTGLNIGVFDSGSLQVEATGNQIESDWQSALFIAEGSGRLSVALASNSLHSNSFGALSLNGSAGRLFVTDFSGNEVTGAAQGAVTLNAVTFDADLDQTGIQTVAGGQTVIGDTGAPGAVTGVGLAMNQVSGSVAFDSLTISNTQDFGLQVSDSSSLILSTSDGAISTDGGSAMQLASLTANLRLSDVISMDSSAGGLTLDSVSGMIGIGSVVIENTQGDGLVVRNSAAAITLNSLDVNGAWHGLVLEDTSGNFAITGTGTAGAGGTIQNVQGRGVLAVNSATVSLNNTVIDASGGSRGVGVLVTQGDARFSLTNSTVTGGTEQAVALGADGTGTLSASVSGNTLMGTSTSSLGAGFVAITSAQNGSGGTLNLAFRNNTLSSTGSAGAYLSHYNPVGSTTGGVVTITDFANNTVTSSNAGLGSGSLTGGILVNGATFDADLATTGIQTVSGGTLVIGDPLDPGQVVGHGLQLNDVSGSLAFTTLSIANHDGTGLYVNTTLSDTTFELSSTGGRIVTTGQAALDLTGVTAGLVLEGVASSGSAGNGITLNDVSGSIALGNVTVENAEATGMSMDDSSAAVIANSVLVDGAATGLEFGQNAGGGLSVSGTTILQSIGGTGMQLTEASGTYAFGTLNIGVQGAATGMDFRNANVLFQSGTTTVAGDGTLGSVAMDLSGSQNPNGVNATTPSILLGTGADQTVQISSVGTGVRLGSVVDGSAGAYVVYGNQTAGNSGSRISVVAGGLTLDTANLTSVDGFNQGRYEFLGVEFDGLASFQKTDHLIFVGSTSAGLGDGSSPEDRISGTDLLVLGADPSNFDGKTIVLVNDNDGAGINLNANSLALGTNTTLDSFGNGQTFSTNGVVPVNVIVDTIQGSVEFTHEGGAATLTNDGTLNLVTLGNGNTIQNVILDGGMNTIAGEAIADLTVQGTVITGSGAAGIRLSQTSGLIGINDTTISSATGDGILLLNAGTVHVNGGAIDGVGGDGIHSLGTNLAVSDITIGGTTPVTGDGIEINSHGGSSTVSVTSSSITGNASGISTRDSGGVGELLLTLDGNTLQGVNAGALGLDIVGSGLNSTIVTSLNGGTVVGNGSNGGVRFQQVTFDRSGTDLEGTAVDAGNWTIGTKGARVEGTGLDLNAPSGNLQFGALNIANSGGAGLAVDAQTLGTTFTLGVAGGELDTVDGPALTLDGITTDLTFQSVSTQNSSSGGLVLNDVAGAVDLGVVSVVDATGIGLEMAGSNAAVTADSLNVNGAATGLRFGNNSGGSFTVIGTTMLAGLTGTGIDLSGAAGSYEFGALNVEIAGSQTGLDFSNSNVEFQSGTTSILGDGSTGSLGLNLSGSLNPHGANSMSSNIRLAVGADQNSQIQNVETGVLLGNSTNGSAGAYLVYGNQTGGSGIEVLNSGLTLDTTHLTSTDEFTQGRYEFLGVTFAGIASFQKSEDLLFAGSTAAGLADGSSPENRLGTAELLVLAANPANFDGKTIALVNDNAGAGIDLGANSLALGTSTVLASFGNGNVISTNGTVPVNVIVDTIDGSVDYADANGAATLTNDGTQDLVALADGNSVEHVILSGGTNSITGTGIDGASIAGTVIRDSSQSGINLLNTMGAVTITDTQIVGTGLNGITIDGSAHVAISGGSVDGTGGDGIRIVSSDVSVQDVLIGTETVVAGSGVAVLNAVTGTEVHLSGNTIRGTTGGLSVVSTSEGGAGLIMTLDGNTYESTGVESKALSLEGMGASSLTVQSLNGGTLVGNGAGGGAEFTGVRFDGSGALLLGTAVTAGDWTMGSELARLQGDGLRFESPGGTLEFGNLNIFNTNGTGLFVNAKSTTFTLGNTGGRIDTTAGSALFLDPLTTDLTFTSVSSTGSLENGITLDQVAGQVSIGELTVTSAAGHGLLLSQSSLTLDVAGGSISGAGQNAVHISEGTASVTYGGTLNNSSGYLARVEGTTGGDIAFTGGVTGNGASQGIRLENNAANIAFEGETALGMTTALSHAAVTSLNNSGEVTFNTLNVNVNAGAAPGGIHAANTSQLTISGGTVSTTGTAALNLEQTTTSITLDSVTASGGTDGLLLNLSGGTLDVGTTMISGVEQTGVDLTGSAGTIDLGTLTVNGARVGIDFRGSTVDFTSGTAVLTGDGSANSIGINLSGTQNPHGANSSTSNIRLGVEADQAAVLSDFGTGVRLGDAVLGSAGANFVYGNQTPLDSGSSISVVTDGISLDGTHLVSTDPSTQGRYEFLGVSITGATTFPAATSDLLFVGSVSGGAADGSTAVDRIDLASLLALTPADLNDRTVVLVNDSSVGAASLDLGSASLVLGENTTVDSFGNGQTFSVGGVVLPVNVINDTLATHVTDPYGDGAAVLTNDGTANVVTLGNNSTVQNFVVQGGLNGIGGNGAQHATINGMTLNGAVEAAILLESMTGTISLDANTITSAGTSGIEISQTGLVTVTGGSISGTVDHGIAATNSSLTVDGIALGATSAIEGMGIFALTDDAENRSLTIQNVTSSGRDRIAGAGIWAVATGTGQVTINLADNTLAAEFPALLIQEAATIESANAVRVHMTGLNTWESGLMSPAVVIQGQNVDSDQSSIVVTSLGSATIRANAVGGGGVDFDQVTFDSDLDTAGNQQVVAGTWTIGQGTAVEQRVAGDGLVLSSIAGNLRFASLNIFNEGCEGLMTNTGEFGTGFHLVVDSGMIDTLHGAALSLDSHSADITLQSVTSTDSCHDGILIGLLEGTLTIDELTVTGAEWSGIAIFESDQLTTTVESMALADIGTVVEDSGIALLTGGTFEIQGGTIDGILGHGIYAENTNLNVTGVSIGTATAVGGNGIQINHLDNATRSVTLDQLTIGSEDTQAVGSQGINILADGMGELTVRLSRTSITSTDEALITNDSGNPGVLILELGAQAGDQAFARTSAGPTIQVTGTSLNSTIITSLGQADSMVTVLANGDSGGVRFNQVTFDQSGGELLGTQATAGTWTLGGAQPIQGDGMRFDAPTGSLAFSELNIVNDGGTGLFVDAKTIPTVFHLSNGGGTIDTTNGAALFLDPLTLDFTLNSVSSTGSSGNGLWLDGVSGQFTVTGLTNVRDASLNGLRIENSSGTIQFGDVMINGTGSTGIYQENNTGSVEFTGSITEENTNSGP